MVAALAAIRAPLTFLDLGWNELDSKTEAELEQIFAALPTSLTSLDLYYNNLGAKDGNRLAKALYALRAKLTCLNLSSNRLNLKTGDELENIIRHLPETLDELDLSDNDFSEDQIRAMLPALRASNIKPLHLGDTSQYSPSLNHELNALNGNEPLVGFLLGKLGFLNQSQGEESDNTPIVLALPSA